MGRFRLVRTLRTLSSEIYVIWQGDRRLGQADIHYTEAAVQADLFLETSIDDDERRDLLAQLDEDIVSSYLPSFEREQFIITLFVGEEVDSVNYPPASDQPGEN